jgi:diguanylate cyclase (GGDEF)-like protein
MIEAAKEKYFKLISEILTTLKSTNQYEKVLHIIIDRVVRLFRCNICAAILIDPRTEYLRIEHSHGLSSQFCKTFRKKVATGAIGRLIWTGEAILIRNSDDQAVLAEEIMLERSFGSCIAVQIMIDQRAIGYLYADSPEKDLFSTADLPALQILADLAGLAIHKTRTYEESRNYERIDPGTGLDKYGPFIEIVNDSLARALAFNQSFALMIFDIDNFKQIIGTQGIEISRVMLKEIGAIIRGEIRQIDAASRYGFDEFVILFQNYGLENAAGAAERIRQRIALESYTADGIKTTISAGIAVYPVNGKTVDDLFLTAKHALYEAQRSGRNKVFRYRAEWFSGEPIECK